MSKAKKRYNSPVTCEDVSKCVSMLCTTCNANESQCKMCIVAKINSYLDDFRNDDVVLEDTDYYFKVVSLKNEKVYNCGTNNEETHHFLELMVYTRYGKVLVKDDLESDPYKINRFFESIGFKKKGEDYEPQWDPEKIIGSSGVVECDVRYWDGKNVVCGYIPRGDDNYVGWRWKSKL